MRSIALVAAGALLACATTSIAEQPRSGNAGEAAASFLQAFNALDVTAFDIHFAEDVTMFFPDGPFPTERVEGKAAVTETFHRFFAAVRGRGRSSLSIVPTKMHVQTYGDVAITSFELAGTDAIGRRSLVWRRQNGAWRIVHFHASSGDLKPRN
jgi:ketosteroid isomerase-like protein